MPNCAVSYCREDSRSNSKLRRVFFHCFPHREKSPERYAKWVEYCRRGKDYVPTRYSCICSSHFRRSDYDAHQLMKLKLMPNESLQGAKLKPGSVPTPPSTEPDPKVAPRVRKERKKKKVRQRVVKSLESSEQSEVSVLDDSAGVLIRDSSVLGDLNILRIPIHVSNTFQAKEKRDSSTNSARKSDGSETFKPIEYSKSGLNGQPFLVGTTPKSQAQSNFNSPVQYYLYARPKFTPTAQTLNHPGIPQFRLPQNGAGLSNFVSSVNSNVRLQPQLRATPASAESSNSGSINANICVKLEPGTIPENAEPINVIKPVVPTIHPESDNSPSPDSSDHSNVHSPFNWTIATESGLRTTEPTDYPVAPGISTELEHGLSREELSSVACDMDFKIDTEPGPGSIFEKLEDKKVTDSTASGLQPEPVAHVKREIDEEGCIVNRQPTNSEVQQKISPQTMQEPLNGNENLYSKFEESRQVLIKSERLDDEALEGPEQIVIRVEGEGSDFTAQEPQLESFLVSWPSLAPFFESCSICREKNAEVERRADGMALTVKTSCGSCGNRSTWKSQS